MIKKIKLLKEQKLANEAYEKHCPVSSPKHYTQGGFDTWDFIAIKKMDFFEGNIVKYIVRWREKNGIEDLKKAKAYLDKLISLNE